MRAIDTNILVRLITRDEPEQLRRAEEFVANGAWVSHVVLAETIWVLASTYERTHSQIVSTIAALLDNERLSFQDREVVVAASDLYRQRGSSGLADCLILEIARKAGHLPLGTFDRKLGATDGAECV